MKRFGPKTSASPWRTFFVFTFAVVGGFAAASSLRAQSGSTANKAGTPSAADAGRMVQELRQADIAGDYYFEFELVAMPRRGEERTFRGRWWGSRNAQGPVRRIEIADQAGKKQRLLLQNGEHAALWRWADGKTQQLGPTELFTPLLPDLELTPFDLQMPFLYWSDVTLQGEQRVRNRPAHVFLFRAPPRFDAGQTQIAAVRVFLDVALHAIMQTELLDRQGRVLKRFSPLAIKIVHEQPIPKAVDFRNDTTGDKARLQLTAVALQLDYDPALFTPAALASDVSGPAADKLVRID